MRRTRSNTGLASLSFGGCSPHLQVHSPFACLRKIRSQWSLLCALCASLVCIASIASFFREVFVQPVAQQPAK